MTFVLAVLDADRHEITLVNAGHMAPLLRHGQGKVEPIGEEETGLPLGVDADFEYEKHTRQLEPGDFLALFTDGISEAMNTSGELYGLERLRKQLAVRQRSRCRIGPLDPRRREAVRRRPPAKRRHVPGLLRPGREVSGFAGRSGASPRGATAALSSVPFEVSVDFPLPLGVERPCSIQQGQDTRTSNPRRRSTYRKNHCWGQQWHPTKPMLGKANCRQSRWPA